MATRASEAPSPDFDPVTPHATDPIHATKGACRSLYIGGSGDIVVKGADSAADRTFVNVPVGVLPISVTHVRDAAAGTTATSIVALW